MAAPTVTRRDVLRFRLRRHQLDRDPGAAAGPTDVALLDYGVQDTGTDGAAWALEIRGAPPAGPDDLALAWTWRGAPHAYRRVDLPAIAVATAPLSDADASKRIFDAVKPLQAAGIPTIEALRVVAGHLREIVTEPTVKGDVSGRLTERVDAPYTRFCRPCGVTHVYEMPFRLAALQAGLELEPGTSPPVLRRIPGLEPPMLASPPDALDLRFDPVRNHLRFYGPARVRDVAAFLDAPPKDVQARWPPDAVEVVVEDVEESGRRESRFLLADDLPELTRDEPERPARSVRLLAPHDPYLQLRDRELLVGDATRRRELWPALGRPGVILVDGEVTGTWRPRMTARKLTLRIDPWGRLRDEDQAAVKAEAARLAAHRGVPLTGVTLGGLGTE